MRMSYSSKLGDLDEEMLYTGHQSLVAWLDHCLIIYGS